MRTIRSQLAALALTTLAIASPAAAQLTRVSVATDGTPGNAASDSAVISGNGRFVAFTSAATNLVPNDTNGVVDVFVRDLLAHTTERVSVTTTSVQSTAASQLGAISDDGKVVAFWTTAALEATDTAECQNRVGGTGDCEDIYVHDATTGETTRVSVATDGTPGNAYSISPVLSADGRYVAFESAASTLVSDDTNGVVDVFLHDRVTHITTRVSIGPGGAQGTTDSRAASISSDGQRIGFFARQGSFGVGAGPAPNCGGDSSAGSTQTVCDAAFVRVVPTAELLRVDLTTTLTGNPALHLVQGQLSRDGKAVLLAATGFSLTRAPYYYELHDLTTGLITNLVGGGTNGLSAGPPQSTAGMSDDARYIAIAGAPLGAPFVAVHDRVSSLTENLPAISNTTVKQWLPPSFDASARWVTFTSSQNGLIVGDNENIEDAFVYDRDQDGDGIPSFWETTFGLDPDNAADAALDPDTDGLSNLQEFQASSDPKATQTRYFAEGAANSFFSTRVAVLNPTATSATVLLRLLGANGHQTSAIKTVAANQRVTFDGPSTTLPDTTFSIVVESDQAVVADRLMTWDATGYGSHLETSIDGPQTTWYLAEGATGSAFSLYYLLQNPGDIDATTTVTYLLPAPQAPIVRNYTVAAHSRFTIDVTGEDPALKQAEVSAKITSSQPIVVERSMYFSRPTQFLAAGHDGAGIAAPASRWFLAEGATGFFDEYVLIANPGGTASDMKVTYLLDDGTSFNETFPVAGNSRYTLDVKRDPRLLARALSIIVESTNAVPVVVERVMWWPSGTANWYEASLSSGVTGTGTAWAIAEGELGGPRNASTYVLVANTDPTLTCNANVKLYFEDGSAAASLSGPVAPNSRATFDASAVLEAFNKRFGITVDCGNIAVPIVVERSFYTTVGGVQWAAGGTSVATNITPVP